MSRIWVAQCEVRVCFKSDREPTVEECKDMLRQELDENGLESMVLPLSFYEAKELNDVPKSWRDCIPWKLDEDDKDERDVTQIFRETDPGVLLAQIMIDKMGK